MSSPNPVEVFDSLHELLQLFRTRLRGSLEAVHPELTFNEMRVLMRTGREPGITQKDLVEYSHTDKAQMARLLAHLQDKGWVERSASESDKRVRCLHLSRQGQWLFSQLRELQEQIASELLQDFSPSEQRQLLALLQQATDLASQPHRTVDDPKRPASMLKR